MLPLMDEQRVKVEENMGLVGKVIQDCVHTLDKGCIYDYDDLICSKLGVSGCARPSRLTGPGTRGRSPLMPTC